MKNNALLIAIVVLVGVCGGLALMISFNNILQMANTPIVVHLNQIQINEKVMIAKLEALEKKLELMETKIGSGRQAPPMPQPPQEDFNKVYTIDVGTSPIEGKKNAPITIVQFTDLQCPFCARFYPPLKEVLKAYPDQVRVVLKNFPLSFHPNARPAAKLALAAKEQGKYFEIVDLLLQNGADVSEAKVKEYAKALNLDYNKLMADLKAKDAEFEKIIADDVNLGGSVDVQGTPTFYINGKKTMARDFNGYKAEIDKILAAK